ncbi:hypothetical protein Acsp06_52890 [Actinomycetospora sp. NBRC 106375]|nr:hypothetical protein Acsp06_52890 [Actinomycetospora sp. NBRC 106375]
MWRRLAPLVAFVATLTLAPCADAAPAPRGPAPVTPAAAPGMRVLTTGLAAPWELTWGPDGWLWVTEKVGRRVDRINPSDGTRTVAVTLDDAAASGAQDGVLGLAFAGRTCRPPRRSPPRTGAPTPARSSASISTGPSRPTTRC